MLKKINLLAFFIF